MILAVDYATLKALKPSDFENAADGYRKAGSMASQAKDDLYNQIIPGMQKSLRGEALDAAVRQLRDLSKNFQYAQVECGLISAALNAFALELRLAKVKLDLAVGDATDAHLQVREDGSISYAAWSGQPGNVSIPGGIVSGGTPLVQGPGINPNHNAAQTYANRISEAVKEATEVDTKWSAKLKNLEADDDLTVSDRDWINTRHDMRSTLKGAADYLNLILEPPKDGTPEENAKWWEGLTEEQRSDYLSLNLATVGTLDGLPSEVRDEGNRYSLRASTARWEMERERLVMMRDLISPDGRYVSSSIASKIRDIDKKLAGLNQVQQHLDSTGEKSIPELYLLGIDTEKNGHAIVSVGNPDEADNVTTYVPGMNTKLETIGSDIERAESLYTHSVALGDPDKKYASLMWLGYDAPQNPVAVAKEDLANQGSPVLNDFLDGLQVSHQGEPANDTLLGHSYGSLVSGKMLSGDETPPVDAVIFVGSPGVGVDHAADLNVPPENVWAGKSRNDLVASLPTRSVYNPWSWGERPFGVDPTEPRFGGQQFGVQDGSKWPPFAAHSLYWDENSESLKNMALIVNGEYPMTGGEPQ
ncbi:alpha/beta hydrolase [Streptomyces sp. NPDC058377]|uniref:alpha/beta hydrolase n=1 Tax=Streptomyces sp. NPDC058377 TaxID=3346468 RepID=UPI0036634A98